LVKSARVSLPLLAAALMLTTSAAVAHRPASRAERRAIRAAAVHQRELSRAQAACQVVTISTVNQSFASLEWPAKLSRACRRVAANGVIIEHRHRGHWRLVTVGSSFECPIKGLQARVAADLGVCP
jgi:hypothetical protein